MVKAEAGAGANYGSALHRFAERLDAGETVASMGVPAQLVPDVEAYARALKEHGLTVLPEYSERTVVNEEAEYAGTWDRIVRARDGALYVLDLKSGKDLSYAWLEIAMQEAMYAWARYVCSRDFTSYEPMPEVDRMKALVLHLPIGSARGQIYGVPIGEAKGWRAARAAMAVRAMRTEAKSWQHLVQPEEPADVVRLHLDRQTDMPGLMAVKANAEQRGIWTADLARHALARWDLIRAATAATREDLAALWAELHPLGRWVEGVNDAAQARAAELSAS
jgi:hypothetical protein